MGQEYWGKCNFTGGKCIRGNSYSVFPKWFPNIWLISHPGIWDL